MSESFDAYYKWLGIPPADQPPHHYRLLAIKVFEKDPDVIANAADRQMAHLRTFQTGKFTDLSQQLLNEVSTARLCLLSPDAKATYDEQLRAKLKLKQTKSKPESTPLPDNRAQSLAERNAFPMDLEFETPSSAAPHRGTGTMESAKKPHSTAVASGRRAKKSSSPTMLYVGVASVAAMALAFGLVAFMSSGPEAPVAKKVNKKQPTSSNQHAPLKVTKFDKSAKPSTSSIPTLPQSKQLPPPAANRQDRGESVTIDNGDANYAATGEWINLFGYRRGLFRRQRRLYRWSKRHIVGCRRLDIRRPGARYVPGGKLRGEC